MLNFGGVIILTRQAGGYLDIRLPFGFAPECGAGSLEAGFGWKVSSQGWLCVCVSFKKKPPHQKKKTERLLTGRNPKIHWT